MTRNMLQAHIKRDRYVWMVLHDPGSPRPNIGAKFTDPKKTSAIYGVGYRSLVMEYNVTRTDMNVTFTIALFRWTLNFNQW